MHLKSHRSVIDALKCIADKNFDFLIVKCLYNQRSKGEVLQLAHFFFKDPGRRSVHCEIQFGPYSTTYCLNFFTSCSAALGIPISIVLSTPRSLFAVSSTRCANLLSFSSWNSSQPVSKIRRRRPTWSISMIAFAMENVVLTWSPSMQSGSFFRSVCANRDVVPRAKALWVAFTLLA